jgi:hypothetical protein
LHNSIAGVVAQLFYNKEHERTPLCVVPAMQHMQQQHFVRDLQELCVTQANQLAIAKSSVSIFFREMFNMLYMHTFSVLIE